MFLPVLLFAIPAGAVIDRLDRRLVLGTALSIQTICTAGIGSWFAFGGDGLLPIFALLFVSGAAHSFINPALSSITPRLVPREILSNAIATQSSMGKMAQLVGPVLGGLLVASVGMWVFAATAALFLFAAFSAILIRVNLRIAGLAPFTASMIFDGLRYIWRTPNVRAAMSLDVIAVMFGGVVGILPVYAVDILHVGSEGLGLLRAAPAVGGLAIGILLATFRFPWPVGRTFFISLAMFSIAVIVFGLSTNILLSIIALATYGATDMMSVNVRQTLIQLDTPDELRGRVSSVNTISAGGSTQLGDFRAGVMASAIGTPAAVVFGGLTTLVATALWWRFNPSLRSLVSFHHQ
jgi:MFS family permease